jgi:dihydroxyacetone kinase
MLNQGGGDTGSSLATAGRAHIEAMDAMPRVDHTQLYHAIGLELSQIMGGSFGVLLAIFFPAAGDASVTGRSMRKAS